MQKLLRFITVIFLFAAAELSLAASATGTATVTIREAVNLTETKVVQFGELDATNGSCVLDADANLSGSNGSSCKGAGQLGEFLIAGTADQSVEISVSAGSDSNGVSFVPVLHSDSHATLKNGSTVAKVGGEMRLASAEAGVHALSYVISVNYN